MAPRKRIVLSGATGYLGSRLAKAFCDDGHDLILLKRSTSEVGRIAELLKRTRSYDVDVTEVADAFDEVGAIDAVVHCATNYGRAGEPFSSVLEANTVFGVRLLEAAMRSGVPWLVNTDTSLDASLNPYALSKAQFGSWCRLAAEQGSISVCNLVLEHFYGPGDDPKKFIGFLIRDCLANVPQIPLTAGEQRRDFIYIEDVVRAYQTILRNLEDLTAGHHEFAIGSGEAIRVREVAESVRDICASSSELQFGARPYRSGEPMFLCADIAKMSDLGWHPRVGLRQGISEAVSSARETLGD